MTRATLPARRPCTTCRVVWRTETGEFRFVVTAGFDTRTRRLSEVFYSDGMKTGTQLQASVQDACVILSIALQHGATLADLGKTLASAPVHGGTAPASIIGAIVETLKELER